MKYTKMNPAVKALWIGALRSGEYKQGTGELQPTPDTYCCLGVLTDLHVKESPERIKWRSGVGPYGTERGAEDVVDKEVAICSLLGATTDWAGIVSYDAAEVVQLIDLNDVEDSSFEEIADWIEENL